jgi:hypothetical protein
MVLASWIYRRLLGTIYVLSSYLFSILYFSLSGGYIFMLFLFPRSSVLSYLFGLIFPIYLGFVFIFIFFYIYFFFFFWAFYFYLNISRFLFLWMLGTRCFLLALFLAFSIAFLLFSDCSPFFFGPSSPVLTMLFFFQFYLGSFLLFISMLFVFFLFFQFL